MNKKTDDGAKVYTPFSLKLYDWWVLNISNRYAWKCSTEQHLLPHFINHVDSRHLDVGVGTGFYLTHLPNECSVSLMDLNASSLNAASDRVGRNRVDHTIKHDVFETYPHHLRGQFGSLSLFYLLHCLPGQMKEKAPVIHNAAEALTKDGRLFGATILGDGVEHNFFGQKLMNVYNKKGIFSNRGDNAEDLRAILSDTFKHVNVDVVGKVALFSASERKN